MSLNHGYAYQSRILPDGFGQSLADYLADHYPHATPDEWRERIERGELWIDDRQADNGTSLRAGQTLVWKRPPWEEPEAPTDFEVIAVDDTFVAVSKPSGLPTLPGAGFLERTLLFQVQLRFPEAVPMHRLGRGTSGLVLFARTEAARRSLQRDWQRRSVDKRYLAVVRGLVPESCVLEVPIGRVPHPILGALYAATPLGKHAYSQVRRIADLGDRSLAEVRIDTGRPHQIRIHMAAMGHPLDGDPLYREGGVPYPGSRALPGEVGYLLHAWKLGFTHPESGVAIALTAPPPESWHAHLPPTFPSSRSPGFE